MVKAEEIDYACSSCGFIRKGPHTGETVPSITQTSEYKGAPLSHAGPEECPNCGENARRLRRAGRTGTPTVGMSKAEREVIRTSRYHVASPKEQSRLRRQAVFGEVMRDLRKGTQFE